MRKTLTYSSFVIISLVVAAAFVTARTYTQLGVAVVLYPVLAYFVFKLLPRKAWKAPVVTVQFPTKSAQKAKTETAEVKREDVNVADIDKRAFLKLIGATGISLFLFSLLNKRAEVPFFGRGVAAGSGVATLTDTAGNKIDPAQQGPTDGYRISEIEDNETTFYGFTNKNGNWFVMKEDPETGSFRYSKGESNFPTNWTNRKYLKYDYFHNAFA